MKNITLLFVILLLVTGCAAMNEDDCMLADWQAIGYQTGVQGNGTAVFTQYQKDCSKYQIKADFDAFRLGHQQGVDKYCIVEQGINDGAAGEEYNTLCTRSRYTEYYDGYQIGIAQYCTYENGYNRGKQGVRANSICRKSDFPDYFLGHDKGRKYYEISEKISDLEAGLVGLKKRIEDLDKDIERAEKVIISDTSSQDERRKALDNINSYRATQNRLVKEYYEIKEQLAVEQDRLERLSYAAFSTSVI